MSILSQLINERFELHVAENIRNIKEYIDIPHDVEFINDGTIKDLTDLFDIFYERY